MPPLTEKPNKHKTILQANSTQENKKRKLLSEKIIITDITHKSR